MAYDLQNQNSWMMPLRSPCKVSTSDRLASSHSSRILWRNSRCFGHVISGCRVKNAAQGIVYWCCGGRTVGCEERSYTLYEKAAFQCRWWKMAVRSSWSSRRKLLLLACESAACASWAEGDIIIIRNITISSQKDNSVVFMLVCIV